MRKIKSQRRDKTMMDMDKFFDLLMENEHVKGIPLMHVLYITLAVFEIINSGECFYKIEEAL